MKKFKVIVDGQSFVVEVEELEAEHGQASTRPLKSAPSSPSAVSRDSAAAKEAAPVEKTRAQEEKPREASGQVVENGISEKAPMPGSVIEVKVQEGDKVEAGDVLIVLEAMKMENEIVASKSGTVTRVLVKKGDSVNSNDVLIVLS